MAGEPETDPQSRCTEHRNEGGLLASPGSRIVPLCPAPASEAYPCKLPDLPSLPAALS